MNLKDMKKVHEDEHKATFKNKSGHTIGIAKKGLSPKLLKELSALPLHAAEGDVIEDPTKEFADEDPNATDVTGRPVKKYAGSDRQSTFSSRVSDDAYKLGRFLDNPVARAAEAAGINSQVSPKPDFSSMAAKEPEQPQMAEPAPDKKPSLAPEEKTSLAPQPKATERKPSLLAESQPASDAAPVTPTAAPLSQSDELIQANEARQKAKEQYEVKNAESLGAEDAAWKQDLRNGHISPQTYGSLFAKQDTLGKIGTLFGLLLSGAGSGLSGQPNMVMEMMNKEIENDRLAQEKSKDNARNFIKLNMEAELNKANMSLMQAQQAGVLSEIQLRAQTMAYNQMAMSALHSMSGMVDRLPPGPAKDQAAQIVNGVSQAASASIQQKNQAAAAELAEMQFQKSNEALEFAAAASGKPELARVAQFRRDRHVPGYGEASLEVPGGVRQSLIGKSEFDRAAKEYIAFAEKHKYNLNKLNPAERAKIVNQGVALAADVQNKYRMKNEGGVWKSGEQEFIENTVPSHPEKWSASFNAIPKLKQALHDNEADAKNLAGGYGIKGFQGFGGGSQPASDSGPKEGQTGTSKSGKPIVFKDGKWTYK